MKFEEKLQNLRFNLDDIDLEILKLIKKRMDIVKKIGELKRTNRAEVKDEKREKELLEKLIKIGSKMDISEGTIKKIWRKLFKLSYKIEEDI